MSEADDLLAQARTRLMESEALLRAGLYDGAVGRAYYAAFAAARAMLAADAISAKTHRGVIQQFGKVFVQSGTVDVRLGRAWRSSTGSASWRTMGLGTRCRRPKRRAPAHLHQN